MKTAHDAGRTDPFGDLGDFTPAVGLKTKPEPEVIQRILNENPLLNSALTRKNDSSTIKTKTRQQYRTGRNMQFNIRVSADTIERFHRIANSQSWALGETLEYALDALEKNLKLIQK